MGLARGSEHTQTLINGLECPGWKFADLCERNGQYIVKVITLLFFYKQPVYKQPGLRFSKITIEYNRLLLSLTIEKKRKFKQLRVLGLSQVVYKKKCV